MFLQNKAAAAIGICCKAAVIFYGSVAKNYHLKC